MIKIIHYNISTRFMVVFFVILSITMLFAPNYFLKIALADHAVPRYDGEIIFPVLTNVGVNTNNTVSILPMQNTTYVNTNHTNSINLTQNYTHVNTNNTVSITPAQNTTVYVKTAGTAEGFSNIVCKSGYQYVQMTAQYTAGNISYKVIFLRMLLLDNNGFVIAKGFGLVDDVDAHKTKTFNAITRYPFAFSSCAVQIDNAIPK